MNRIAAVRKVLFGVVATLALGVLAPEAVAGTYTVRACFDPDYRTPAWTPAVTAGTMSAYSDCPGRVGAGGRSSEGMIAQHSAGPRPANPFDTAQLSVDAPQGAQFTSFVGDVKLNRDNGWQVGIRKQGNPDEWIYCGDSCLSTFGQFIRVTREGETGFSTSRITAVVVCGSGEGCQRDGSSSFIALRNVTLAVSDISPPTLAIEAGGLNSPGWHQSGTPLTVSANDNVGIRQYEAAADGMGVGGLDEDCDDHLVVPCPSGESSLVLNTNRVPDGRHTLTVRAYDSAGNPTQASVETLTDNHAPARVRDLSVDGGDGWRATRRVTLRWRNPAETGVAPLVAAEYELCRTEPEGPCVRGSRDGENLAELTDLELPGPGLWRISVWMRDAAGNQEQGTPDLVKVGLDEVPPDLSMLDIDPSDPARLRFSSTDALSGIARGEVELQRSGSSTWRPIESQLIGDRLEAVVDDESLKRGTYAVRARVFDRAGNERSVDHRPSGAPTILSLPLRVDTRLRVGLVRVTGRRRHRRHRLVKRPLVRYGTAVKLRGRLTSPGRNPLAARNIEVYQRIGVSGSSWTRVATVRTRPSGRFVYRVLKGPTRQVRFRFAGSPTERGLSRIVNLRVRASSTVRVSRHNVVNGEEVTFRGRLGGRPLPRVGKLLQLQAYARGHWLTFATPRARSRSGRWSHRYRFAATRGSVRYRFRVRIPKEGSYPYAVGHSRSVRVTVRGL